jgi:hypothetical protein
VRCISGIVGLLLEKHIRYYLDQLHFSRIKKIAILIIVIFNSQQAKILLREDHARLVTTDSTMKSSLVVTISACAHPQ